MPFDWRSRSADLFERFPSDALGYAAWHELIGRTAERRDFDELADLRAFDAFLAAASREHQRYREAAVPKCRVFVSHQRQDVGYAERVAYLATQHRLDYWLDVHDPILAAAQQISHDPRYGIVIAAIIEIALLNCTHVVAVQTSNSAKSKWVPYEFGRAKARSIASTQACSWFEPSLQPSSAGQEYVFLAYIAHGGESALDAWFKLQQPQGALSGQALYAPSSAHWAGEVPNRLPGA
jgi:hypothetical protein